MLMTYGVSHYMAYMLVYHVVHMTVVSMLKETQYRTNTFCTRSEPNSNSRNIQIASYPDGIDLTHPITHGTQSHIAIVCHTTMTRALQRHVAL